MRASCWWEGTATQQAAPFPTLTLPRTISATTTWRLCPCQCSLLRRTGPHDNSMDPRDDDLSADDAFGPVHMIEPSSEHTHTAIMLHGRGSNGPEFAEELAETAAPGQKSLMERFPSWRWVFPSSQELWSTAFEEMLPAWFEAHSLTDTTTREDLQIGGIRQSVAYIQSILTPEVARLGGKPRRWPSWASAREGPLACGRCCARGISTGGSGHS